MGATPPEGDRARRRNARRTRDTSRAADHGSIRAGKSPPRTARRAFWDVQSCGNRDQTVPMPNTPMTMKYRTMGKMMREMIFRPRPHFIMSFREISPVP